MISALLKSMQKTVVENLRHKSIRLCADWAEKFRVMGNPFPGPYSFRHHPWTREMLNWDRDWCGMKAAQMGFTEVALNRCFFVIDILKNDVMYVLPKADPDASDFSAARFTPALELSPHLSQLFSEANNVGHKRAGSVNLYVRGAQSRSGLKSAPVSLMIFDELDEMPEKNVELGLQRTAGQVSTQIAMLSTPTIPGFGIHRKFQETTQEHFFFPCPLCSRWTELTYPDCIVITAESLNDTRINESYYICKECKGALHHEDKESFLTQGAWRATANLDSEIRGFQINRMYSMAKSGNPIQFAREALKSRLDPTSDQEFHNSVLGAACIVEGAQILQSAIDSCKKSYGRNETPPTRGHRVMGVDTGSFIHYEIDEYYLENGPTTDVNALSNCKQITHGKVTSFEDLDKLMRDYQILACVVDANPDRREARKFAARFPGHVYLCFYSRGLKGNDVTANKTAFTLSVDRTVWMDTSTGRFKSGKISLPHDTTEEYQTHIKNVVRKYDRDPDGNPVGSWLNTGPDHYTHARTYAEIGLPLALSLTTNQDIGSFL